MLIYAFLCCLALPIAFGLMTGPPRKPRGLTPLQRSAADAAAARVLGEPVDHDFSMSCRHCGALSVTEAGAAVIESAPGGWVVIATCFGCNEPTVSRPIDRSERVALLTYGVQDGDLALRRFRRELADL